ncbi:hypothetical protein [Streptomyces anulatus]|uniref:hypothetical protein n=1 Tax=Streptomyces anulatus TaxID=1892 RepID=UPI0034467CDB
MLIPFREAERADVRPGTVLARARYARTVRPCLGRRAAPVRSTTSRGTRAERNVPGEQPVNE